MIISRFLRLSIIGVCFAGVLPPVAVAQDYVSAFLDGRLSASEYQALGRSRFSLADFDGNGVVTQQEFINLGLADFDRADLNKDGRIMRGEVRGLVPSGDAPYISAGGFTRTQAANVAVTRFAYLDVNRDGTMTSSEYTSQLATEFTRADLNRDGFLDRGELRGLQPTY